MLNIPQDYEPYKLNCVAGDAVVGILCRRPDGGVSDWHATMNKKAVNGICPISGAEMKEVSKGVYVRKTGDITVVMTNAAATAAHLGGSAKRSAVKREDFHIKFCRGCNKRTGFDGGECNFCAMPSKDADLKPKKRTYMHRKPKATERKVMSDSDIAQVVNDAMKEAGL
tara:strand:+ start:1387 stop:1893 length:507 start_codon:yes stop_codon:yes gene_type:complete